MEQTELLKMLALSTILSHYLDLERRGSFYQANCPFHGDEGRSMKVNDTRGLFKCFTCGVGGDAITFLMELEGMSYHEALARLKADLGL